MWPTPVPSASGAGRQVYFIRSSAKQQQTKPEKMSCELEPKHLFATLIGLRAAYRGCLTLML